MTAAASSTGTTLRGGAQPGEQRLVAAPRAPRVSVEAGHELFDVERHPVTAVDHRRPIIRRECRIQGGDQRVGLLVGQRRQVEHLGRPTCLAAIHQDVR